MEFINVQAEKSIQETHWTKKYMPWVKWSLLYSNYFHIIAFFCEIQISYLRVNSFCSRGVQYYNKPWSRSKPTLHPWCCNVLNSSSSQLDWRRVTFLYSMTLLALADSLAPYLPSRGRTLHLLVVLMQPHTVIKPSQEKNRVMGHNYCCTK